MKMAPPHGGMSNLFAPLYKMPGIATFIGLVVKKHY